MVYLGVCRQWTPVLLLLCNPLALALESLSDDELESTTGQAFITVDNYDYAHTFEDGSVGETLNYTRINLGLDIKINMNADEVVFGQYDRPGELTGAQTPYNADLYFKNYAMGHVDLEGNRHPFNMIDPYIEFAYDRSDPSAPEFAGFRFGFGKSLGMLSIDAKAFTGNVDVVVSGNFTVLNFITLQAAFTSSLVDASGNPDPIRATTIGVRNGESVTIDWWPRDLTFEVNNCRFAGQELCFELKTFESMLIGTSDGQPAPGLFQSVQARPMGWLNDPSNNSAGVVEAAVTGWFFNIPNGSTTMTPDEAAAGRPRVATEFVDRGVGRFHTAGYLIPEGQDGHIPWPTYPDAP